MEFVKSNRLRKDQVIASWVETRPLLTVGALSDSVLRMLGAATLQFRAAIAAAPDSDWCADASGDGSVSATDALLILNRGIGLDVPLRCDDPCAAGGQIFRNALAALLPAPGNPIR